MNEEAAAEIALAMSMLGAPEEWVDKLMEQARNGELKYRSRSRTIYRTDFGDVFVSESFLSEAEARWPGIKEWEEWNEEAAQFDKQSRPNWDEPVMQAMRDHMAVYMPHVVYSLAQIGL